ncbi:type I restriction enzyme HsdR N-terminal domain-containing protein [Flavobacterium cerinum]|uniref:Type I restriction enzyme HsdR N-terminal domain-containing protein n=1 Tax=Flavobacterium cerinum TaxID=2502784 RepID=A0ABY5IRY4_9FLAO|nr:type I restriction enzyme HsdR N-terminal domain-containing protein [Flavobacterium cerinum]UUC44211.1 type I restriction enzyme HsdR N-terminal domain-containing protein [Flavobacterium cerinum]
MNEEDIRGRLLLPYIHDLGFDVSEISLEMGFIVRLGKKKYMRGRSDILCKRNNRNLFVIELKRDSVEITQDDIDQGISYARLLLDDIAPFTIITNGVTTRIFDSITRKELLGSITGQSSFYNNGYTLSTEEDLKIRYEALKNFVALSPTNLKAFCQMQVYDRMGQIIGNINSPYSKFVKEIHIQRQELHTAFQEFLQSSQSIFGLVGSAGVGKTSAICSLALQNIENMFVFFYNAAIIRSPLECIAQDLNINFSSRSETDIVLKKLDEIGRFADKTILIFIDAVDENTNPDISLELSEVALMAKDLDKVKIVISCKSNIWDTILKIKNKPTHLHEELCKNHNLIKSLSNNPGFLLEDFSEEELEKVIPLYQEVFGFKGEISKILAKELRNGFFLKIFSEVYMGKKVPEKITDQGLIKKYLKKSLDDTDMGYISGARILAEIGKVLLTHSYSHWEEYKDEGLDINHFLERLNFSIDDNIPEDLFTRNILIKSNTDDSYNVSFYYSKIRDYVICFHSYRLDKLSDDDFYDILCDFYRNHIGRSALDFYIENARSSHLQTLVRFKKDKALSYVINYDSYLENNFKKFKNKFDPNTDGDIGILLPDDLIKGSGYGLFPLEEGTKSKVVCEKINDFFGTESDLLWQRGINIIYSSQMSLFTNDQYLVVKRNIFKQLAEILKKGKFSAYNSEFLLVEEVCLILYYYPEKLGYKFNIEDFFLPRFKSIYPIDLKDLKQRVNKFKVAELYRYESIEKGLKDELIDKALKENNIPEYEMTGDAPPFTELGKIIDILLSNGISEIKQHYLPLPDKSLFEAKTFYEKNKPQDIRAILKFQFSESQAILYLTEFFEKFEKCYSEFVEYCFPTYKDKFVFYSSMPHEYIFYMEDSDILKWGLFGYRASRSGEFKITIKNKNKSDEAFITEEIQLLRSFSLDMILKIRSFAQYPVKTIDKINTSKLDGFCVLRNWVYKFLEDDMKKIFEENK